MRGIQPSKPHAGGMPSGRDFHESNGPLNGVLDWELWDSPVTERVRNERDL